MVRALIAIFSSLILISCADDKVKQYEVEVVAEYPHSRSSYTQGLFFYNDKMYESTGQYGKSTLQIVDFKEGKILKKISFADEYFVEGSVVLDDNLYVLTWTNEVVFVYDPETLEYKTAYNYPRSGWGLTTDGEKLIATDGSSYLYFMTKDFKQLGKKMVKLDGRPIRNLNELEYIDGKIWANVYLEDQILIIDPDDAEVEAVIDCQGLLPKKLHRTDTDVLNGIAYDEKSDKVYLTGKNWPKLYEIKLKEL